MSTLTTLPLGQLVQKLQSGETTSLAVMTEYLDAISQHDSLLNAFAYVDWDSALNQAAAADARRAAGQVAGALAGVPVAIKDVLCAVGQPATCASKILGGSARGLTPPAPKERGLSGFMPPYDATAVARLKQAGAVLIGRTNMDEFAMGSSGENSCYGPTRNPWDTERIPGGSSSGSAVAVAARMAPLALGSDTGGSIRQPASLCGIVGMKPTYGRVSRYGLIAYASSLDQIGPFATDVAGAAMLLEAISGHDSRDSTSVNLPVPAYSQSLDQPLKGLRIGVPVEHFADGLDPETERAVREALNVYKSLGAELKDVHLPHTKYAIATYYLIATSEASSNLSRYDGIHYGHRAKEFGSLVEMYEASRGEGFGDEVKRRIMLGVFALSAGYADKYYTKALQVRRLIRGDFDAAFREVDVIAGPVTPTAAFKIGEKANDPLAMYLGDIYTISANLAGLPGISIPCGFTQAGLPIGLQLQAAPFEEERLLRAARMFERETDWHTRAPRRGGKVRVMELTAKTRLEAIRSMVQAIDWEQEGIATDVVVNAIEERELAAQTLVAADFALPHACIDWDGDLRIVVGRRRDGVDYSRPTGQNVQLIVLLIIGRKLQQSHVELLGAMAELLKRPEIREQLIDAKNSLAIDELLATLNWSQG